MNLADLVNKLGALSGISEDNEEFKALVQVKELATTNIPDEIGGKFTETLTGGLLTKDAAKNDPDIKAHFTALALNGVDTEIEKVIADMELDEETKTLLKNTDSTYKKVSLIPARLKSKYEALIEEAKKGGQSNGDVDKLNGEIAALNTELSGLKDSSIGKDVYDSAIADHAAQILDMNIKTLLAGRKLTSVLPRNVAISAAKNVFDEAIKIKGIKLDASDGLKLKTADGSQDYYEKNQPVNIDDFIDGLLADNKLLDVSPPGGGGNPPNPGPEGPILPPSGANAFDDHAAEVEQLLTRPSLI